MILSSKSYFLNAKSFIFLFLLLILLQSFPSKPISFIPLFFSKTPFSFSRNSLKPISRWVFNLRFKNGLKQVIELKMLCGPAKGCIWELKSWKVETTCLVMTFSSCPFQFNSIKNFPSLFKSTNNSKLAFRSLFHPFIRSLN